MVPSDRVCDRKEHTMTTRFIRLPEVLYLTGLSRSTVYRMEGRGDFPKRRQLGAGSVGWNYGEVIAWMESRQTHQVGEPS
jgi:prophage regulatory protein